jgi:hypothetical protein
VKRPRRDDADRFFRKIGPRGVKRFQTVGLSIFADETVHPHLNQFARNRFLRRLGRVVGKRAVKLPAGVLDGCAGRIIKIVIRIAFAHDDFLVDLELLPAAGPPFDVSREKTIIELEKLRLPDSSPWVTSTSQPWSASTQARPGISWSPFQRLKHDAACGLAI